MIGDDTPLVVHPFSIEIGPLQFTGFGLAVLLGFVIAQIIAVRELTRRGQDASAMPDILIGAVLGAIAGSKIYYALLIGDWSDLFSRGGFVFWGGVFGAFIVVLTMVHIKKLDVWQIADVAGIGIAGGYAVGRTGCWAVGDDYGRPWDSPLAVTFPEGAPPSTADNLRLLFGVEIPPEIPGHTVLAVHPTQLYHVILALGMFGVLWRLRDHRHAVGWLFGAYCVLAGIERFLIEFVRAKDDRWFFGTLTMAQIIAVGFMLVGAAWMAARWRGRGIYTAEGLRG